MTDEEASFGNIQ